MTKNATPTIQKSANSCDNIADKNPTSEIKANVLTPANVTFSYFLYVCSLSIPNKIHSATESTIFPKSHRLSIKSFYRVKDMVLIHKRTLIASQDAFD